MSNNMDHYLRDIDSTQLLTATQEHELALRVREGDSASRDHLARANLRLVVRIAREYIGRGVQLEDLISEGNLGLMRAIEGFDPQVGTRFSTYASFWIKQSIRVALNKGGYAVRLPQYIGIMLSKWRRSSATLRDVLGRDATREEIASEIGLSKKQVQAVMKAQKAVVASQCGTEDVDLAELLPDDRSDAPWDRLETAEEVKNAISSLGILSERAATIMRLRFGLEGNEPATLRNVGDRLGLTRERVRQIEHDSLTTLRESIAA